MSNKSETSWLLRAGVASAFLTLTAGPAAAMYVIDHNFHSSNVYNVIAPIECDGEALSTGLRSAVADNVASQLISTANSFSFAAATPFTTLPSTTALTGSAVASEQGMNICIDGAQTAQESADAVIAELSRIGSTHREKIKLAL